MKKIFVVYIMAFILGFIFSSLQFAQAADVTLRWNTVAEAEGYKLYYGTASGVYLEPDIIEGQATDIYTLTLGPGTYYFALKAYNDYGDSGFSEEAGPVAISSQEPPAVINLGLSVQEKDITANWEYPIDACELNSLEISIDGQTPVALGANTRSYLFANLPNGSHEVVVTAINEFGSVPSNTVSANVEVIPSNPTGFSGDINYKWENGCLKEVTINQ